MERTLSELSRNPLPNRPAESILEVLGEGVAILHPDQRIAWANATFKKWCVLEPIDRDFLEALGSPQVIGPELPPPTTLPILNFNTRLCRRDNNQYLDLRLNPIYDAAGSVERLLALCRDVSAEMQRQLKLDALHDAGRELA